MKITYDIDDKGNISLPGGPPFDGEPVLIKLASGWVEAWWAHAEYSETMDGPECEGFEWVCCDDKFQADLDSATHWLPLPVIDEMRETPPINIRNLVDDFNNGRELLINDRFVSIHNYQVNFDGTKRILYQFDLADGGAILLVETLI